MKKQKPFFKGILGFTRADDDVLAKEADNSIYRWWWEFMRLSPVFWYARTRCIDPVDPKIAETYSLVGDLTDDTFYKWWNTTGRYSFAEAKRPNKVEVLDLNNLEQHPFKEKAFYLEIPLTIRRETILKQIKEKLDEYHDGRYMDLAATSTAKLKLFTKRYRLRTIELEYWVLLYRMLYPKIEMWRIGDRLQISPHLRIRGLHGWEESPLFSRLSSITGRYLYKAKFSLNNLAYGNFPNTTKLNFGEDFIPFGEHHHSDYLKATELDTKEYKSDFYLWLEKEYGNILKNEIIRRNHLETLYRMPDGKVRKRVPKFISGESDLI